MVINWSKIGPRVFFGAGQNMVKKWLKNDQQIVRGLPRTIFCYFSIIVWPYSDQSQKGSPDRFLINCLTMFEAPEKSLPKAIFWKCLAPSSLAPCSLFRILPLLPIRFGEAPHTECIGGWAKGKGGRRRVDARCPSNMAPIGTKLCQNAFRTLPDVWFFDAEKKKNRWNFRIIFFVFRNIGLDFEAPRPNGPQNQLPRQILL